MHMCQMFLSLTVWKYFIRELVEKLPTKVVKVLEQYVLPSTPSKTYQQSKKLCNRRIKFDEVTLVTVGQTYLNLTSEVENYPNVVESKLVSPMTPNKSEKAIQLSGDSLEVIGGGKDALKLRPKKKITKDHAAIVCITTKKGEEMVFIQICARTRRMLLLYIDKMAMVTYSYVI